MFTEKRLIVQFTHPGGEHSPDRGKSVKSWNTGGHKRKFMLANGDCIENNQLVENKQLLFWGEWEPDSEIITIFKNKKGDYPSYLQKPILQTLPNCARQNTDPYVFNNHFYYFCCKQTTKKGITQLARLAKGSIILFGSTINQNTPYAYFALDTVFVVGDYIEFSPENFNELKGKVHDDFFEISVKSAYQKLEADANNIDCVGNVTTKKDSICHPCDNEIDADTDVAVRCYIGATYNNPFEGMYSFVPSRVVGNSVNGFERLQLKHPKLDFISNNLNAAPKHNKGQNNFKEVWDKIRKLTYDNSFVEGFNFKFTKK